MKVLIVEEGSMAEGAEAVMREISRVTPDAHVMLARDLDSLEQALVAMKTGDGPRSTSMIVTSRPSQPPRDPDARLALACPGAPALVGSSSALVELRALVTRVARSPVPTVLITGESGTGKDLVARAIHAESSRHGGAFVTVACSSLTEALLESELFGHEETGAPPKRRPGLLELADGGTLFLDEISEMTPALQAKLLRFIDDRTFRRVGGTTDVQVDVRVLAATHDDLGALVANGRFRQDLYYRLRGVPIHLAPLRERKEDIEALARYFLGELGATFGKTVTRITREALLALSSHHWPGNVRELKHCIERALLLVDGDTLDRVDCGGAQHGSGEHLLRLPREGLVLSELERSLVQQALEATGWNQVRAARLLGLNRDQVRYRIDKFGLSASACAADEGGEEPPAPSGGRPRLAAG